MTDEKNINTTIRVSRHTLLMLRDLGRKGESYEDIILMTLNDIENLQNFLQDVKNMVREKGKTNFVSREELENLIVNVGGFGNGYDE